jgi:hypothetical protein
LIRDFYGEAWTIGGDCEIHAAWRPKIDRMKVLAIERWRDVKAAIREHLCDPGQCLAIGYTQGNVVCDARASLTRSVVGVQRRSTAIGRSGGPSRKRNTALPA